MGKGRGELLQQLRRNGVFSVIPKFSKRENGVCDVQILREEEENQVN
jgi:hypothetical protein